MARARGGAGAWRRAHGVCGRRATEYRLQPGAPHRRAAAGADLRGRRVWRAPAAARALGGVRTVFVGVGLPNIACNLARHTVAPQLELIYEAGVYGARPSRRGRLAACARCLWASGYRISPATWRATPSRRSWS